MKPANGHLRHFSVLKIYQFNLIIGNDRPQVIPLFKFSDIERFVIQTNDYGKTLNDLCPIFQLVSQISSKETVLLLYDSTTLLKK